MKETRWTTIRPGDLILDKSGKEWTVTAINIGYGQVSLVDVDDKAVSGAIHPLKLVRRVYTAEELLAKHLDAEIIGIDDPTGYIVPATMDMAPIISSHLFMMHGMYTKEIKALAKLREAH